MEHTYQDMRMEDPVAQFTYLVDQFKQRFPKLAYLHVVAPKTLANVGPKDPSQANFIYDLWAPRHVISTGRYDHESGVKTAEVIGYGMMFLANPDLPFRLKKNLALNARDYSTLFTAKSAEGYTTYTFSEEFLKTQIG
ncbi:uncharacterized protein BXZ73DRAFT_106327 [Epithele typhae]|uniref:uncharacterized protein n=1 Tax=Epithele typhae TaxID=378194 RepID=UPI002008A2DB|nr:uncharacterized protein BXZ73DRAFT_106327 [Epithele typhae]KAH9915016.1 hypothetical protein BXZ73DRAFT_106327 [Epithele typhae]